jgi:hypothetical protein
VSDLKKPFEAAIARVLKPLGYRKRGATWHLDREDVISVVNLQKSQWGDDLYLNLGIYLKRGGEELRPAEARCHVRCRLTSLAACEMPRDPETLGSLVKKVAVPWLDRLSTREGLVQFLRSEESRACFVEARAAKILGAEARLPPEFSAAQHRPR